MKLSQLVLGLTLALGFVANLLIRPVAERFHEPAGPAAEPALTGKRHADREGQSR